MPSLKSVIAFWVILLALAPVGLGYMVGPAVPLDQMAQKADLIVKATAISQAPVQDADLPAVAGFPVQSTRFKVISVIQGDPAGDMVGNMIEYRHYARGTGPLEMYEPQHFEFIMGRTYLVFAKRTAGGGIFHQLWNGPTADRSGDALLAADDKPVTAKNISQVAWVELTRLTASKDSADVCYAIGRLNTMSDVGDRFEHSNSFDRGKVAEAIRPALRSKDAAVLTAAVEAAGSENAFVQPERVIFWFAANGHSNNFQGLSPVDPHAVNLTGKLRWPDLARVVDSDAPAKIRASAVRAMGRSGAAELPAALDRWAQDREPIVRQAAIVLLGDVPTASARRRIVDATHDESPEARVGAAQAIGISQDALLEPLLGPLLKDPRPEVRDAAAASLLSFDEAVSGNLLRANIHDPEYRSLFVNALARVDPMPYLADLDEIGAKKLEPSRFWGGVMPAYESWDILYHYVSTQAPEAFHNGTLTPVFNVMDGTEWLDSGKPSDLFALYVNHGLKERAQAYWARCKKQSPNAFDKP